MKTQKGAENRTETAEKNSSGAALIVDQTEPNARQNVVNRFVGEKSFGIGEYGDVQRRQVRVRRNFDQQRFSAVIDVSHVKLLEDFQSEIFKLVRPGTITRIFLSFRLDPIDQTGEEPAGDFVLRSRPKEQGHFLFVRDDRPKKQFLVDVDQTFAFAVVVIVIRGADQRTKNFFPNRFQRMIVVRRADQIILQTKITGRTNRSIGTHFVSVQFENFFRIDEQFSQWEMLIEKELNEIHLISMQGAEKKCVPMRFLTTLAELTNE